jgi:hypothetical protein
MLATIKLQLRHIPLARKPIRIEAQITINSGKRDTRLREIENNSASDAT